MTPDTSIILKGLTPLLKPSANWLGRKIIGEEILERRQLEATALQPILQKAADEVAETIEPFGAAETDQICLFLTSNEAEAIVRQIYAADILESKEQNLEQIKQEFLKAFSLYTNIPENELRDSAPQIFNTLVTGCEEALQVAIDGGRLSAHEAKSVFRYQVLLDEIATIQKNIELLNAPQKLDVKAILEFEQKYREQVEELHGQLTPPYIDVAKKLPINELYVCSNFSQEISSRDFREKPKAQSEFYQSIYRTVLLGNPGGGKSTCAQKFCYDLVTQYLERLLGGRQVTPILVILRDYGAKKKEIHCSLLEFIELNAKTKYQLKPPDDAFEYLLLNGRIALIFDGLDELTETSYRQEIRNDVELFCNLYSSVPILVTSREIGYKEAPLDESKFEVYRLAPFEDLQVEEYVTKWFAIDRELTKEQQKEKVAAFLTESKNLTDLRSNPLMLGLMCNIYKGEGYIPRNRPDVYAKCAEMLFERWDRGRNIKLPDLVKNIESKIKPLMMYLANWIYEEQSLQSGVTEKKLVEKAADYLCEKRFEDRDDAECAARAFIHFCRGRAWVFTNVGTNKNDEELYQFTHRTFLEYFTAARLVSINRTPKELFDFLLPKIAKQEWDVVSQLAFQIQNRSIEDAGDELLSYLLKEIEIGQKDNNEKWNLISFAVRCLEFIVFSPKITTNIVTLTIEEGIKFGLSQFEDNDREKNYCLDNEEIVAESIQNIGQSDWENKTKIISVIQELIIKHIDSSNYKKAALALEVSFLTDELIDKNNRVIMSSDFVNHIKVNYKNQLETILQKDIFTCNAFKNLFKIHLSDIIKWHNLENTLKFSSCRIATHFSYSSILLRSINILIDPETYYDELLDKLDIEDISYIGKTILNYQLPIVINNNIIDRDLYVIISHYLQCLDIQKKKFRLMIQNPNIFFGIYIIFSIFLETKVIDKKIQRIIRKVRYNESLFFQVIYYTFLARYAKPGKYDRKVELELDKCKFNQEQRDFIWKWVRREINLVSIVDNEEENDALTTNF